MNKLFALLLIFVSFCYSQDISHFNKTLADSLNADLYGMKTYNFVILKTGTSEIKDTAVINSLFRGHMQNIKRLSEDGVLIVAGPFMKNPHKYRGLYIFNTNDTLKTKEYLKLDPAINEGLLDYDIFLWYGSAALPMYLDYHKQIVRESF